MCVVLAGENLAGCDVFAVARTTALHNDQSSKWRLCEVTTSTQPPSLTLCAVCMYVCMDTKTCSQVLVLLRILIMHMDHYLGLFVLNCCFEGQPSL